MNLKYNRKNYKSNLVEFSEFILKNIFASHEVRGDKIKNFI